MNQHEGQDLSLLRVAIIGAGQVAQDHVRAFAKLGSDVRIIGIADIEYHLAEKLAATCGAEAFEDYQVLLQHRPDIAVICLPHHLHKKAQCLYEARLLHRLLRDNRA